MHVRIRQPHFRQHQQMAMRFAVAREHGDDVAFLAQTGDEAGADEAGTPEDADVQWAHGKGSWGCEAGL